MRLVAQMNRSIDLSEARGVVSGVDWSQY